MVDKIDSVKVSCNNGDGAACLAKQKDELETKLNSIMTKHPENEAEISDVKRKIAMLDTEGRYLPAGNLQSALSGTDKKPTAEEQASKAESIKKTNEMLGLEIDFDPSDKKSSAYNSNGNFYDLGKENLDLIAKKAKIEAMLNEPVSDQKITELQDELKQTEEHQKAIEKLLNNDEASKPQFGEV